MVDIEWNYMNNDLRIIKLFFRPEEESKCFEIELC